MENDNFESPPVEPMGWAREWIQEAGDHGLKEPTAMGLATVDARGRPSLRMVLFKGFNDGGFTFYTNAQSRKGAEIGSGADVALCFWWDRLYRQLRVEGPAKMLDERFADEYFASRPRGSQTGAWASAQSESISNRAEMDARFGAQEARFEGREVPRPPYWAGYQVMPRRIEFWQGQANRMHDRMQYDRGADGHWSTVRLQP